MSQDKALQQFVILSGESPIINLKQTAESQAVYIDQDATTCQGLHIEAVKYGQSITNAGTGYALRINQAGNGISVDINKSATGSGNCIDVDNAGTGYGIYVLQSGAANALVVNKTHTGSSDLIVLTNSGSGYDVKGNNSNWYVDKNGNAKFNSVSGGGVRTRIGWWEETIVANRTNECMEGYSGTNMCEGIMPYSGSIVAITVDGEGVAITAGSVSFHPTINDTDNNNLSCILNTTYPTRNYNTVAPGTITFNAGDTIGVHYTSSSDLAGSGLIIAYLYVMFN